MQALSRTFTTADALKEIDKMAALPTDQAVRAGIRGDLRRDGHRPPKGA